MVLTQGEHDPNNTLQRPGGMGLRVICRATFQTDWTSKWIRSGHFGSSERCPLLPRKRTSLERVETFERQRHELFAVFGDASYLRSLRRNCRQRTEQDLRCLALKQPRKETQWIVEAFDEKLSDCRISLRGMQDRLGMRVGGQKHAV